MVKAFACSGICIQLRRQAGHCKINKPQRTKYDNIQWTKKLCRVNAVGCGPSWNCFSQQAQPCKLQYGLLFGRLFHIFRIFSQIRFETKASIVCICSQKAKHVYHLACVQCVVNSRTFLDNHLVQFFSVNPSYLSCNKNLYLHNEPGWESNFMQKWSHCDTRYGTYWQGHGDK